MSALRKLTEDDFVWTALSTALLGRRTKPGDFTSINCPMCVLRGQARADQRFRCGVRYDAEGIGISCFNCGFKTRWRVGDFLGRNMREFLSALGVASTDIRRMDFRARSVHRLLAGSTDTGQQARVSSPVPSFEARALPPHSATIEEWAQRGCEDPDFIEVVQYLFGRGDELAAAGCFHWTPHTGHGLNHRLLIPCLHEGRTVGWVARHVRHGVPKYFSEVPPHYLFNSQAMARRERSVLVVVEGVLDAIAIDGVATMGARLNEQQEAWIRSSGLRVVVLPDRDQAGSRLIDAAVSNGWSVSFPRRSTHSGIGAWWESDVKDAAQAAQRYGRLYVLQSILTCATSSPIEIAIKRQRMSN